MKYRGSLVLMAGLATMAAGCDRTKVDRLGETTRGSISAVVEAGTDVAEATARAAAEAGRDVARKTAELPDGAADRPDPPPAAGASP
jgi:hypothetical protein